MGLRLLRAERGDGGRGSVPDPGGRRLRQLTPFTRRSGLTCPPGKRSSPSRNSWPDRDDTGPQEDSQQAPAPTSGRGRGRGTRMAVPQAVLSTDPLWPHRPLLSLKSRPGVVHQRWPDKRADLEPVSVREAESVGSRIRCDSTPDTFQFLHRPVSSKVAPAGWRFASIVIGDAVMVQPV